MATIGQQLTTPEAGWKRYDDSDLHINFINTNNTALWTKYQEIDCWQGGNYTAGPTGTIGAKIRFRFNGTQLRIIARKGDTNWRYSSQIKITIDNEPFEIFSEYGSLLKQVIVYEKLNLLNGLHTVEIENLEDYAINLDAVDINETGYLLHPLLPEKTNLSELQVGDVISCEYVVTSTTLGSFQNLGKATKPLIPLLSSATPNGSFYFIHVGYDYLGRKKLIADRNIQHSISWDILNTAGLMVENNRLFSSGNIALGKTVTGEFNASYPGSNAVDGNSTTQALLIHGNTTQESTTTRQRSVTIDLVEPKQINEMVIYSGYGFTSFDIEVSDDNITFTKIYSGTMAINSNKRFTLPPYTAARYFSISNIKSDYSGSASLGLSEVELYEGEYYTLSMPTGGTSATDKDNDWDKIIVESTLGGIITAGDNNIWNWNGTIGSWTTSMGSTNTTRVRRGYNTGIGAFTNNIASSSATANTGFRPILLVEDNIIVKSLIKDSLGRYIGLNGGVFYNAGTTLTDEIFQTYGIINLNLINWVDLYTNYLPPFEIASYVQEVYTPSLIQIVDEKEYTVVGRVYEKQIEVNDLERIKNIQVG